MYNAVDVEGLHTLGTVVVDYRGYRITAQSIIPGILEREQEQSVIYGSVDFGKSVLSNEKYLELMNVAATHLKILPHHVLNDKDEAVELCSAVECKGIIGNDKRHYILDLLKTFPPDVNFQKHPDIVLSKRMQEMGFPIEHKHKLNVLRQELLDSFVEDRYIRFIRSAAYNLQKLCSTKKQEGGEGKEESEAVAAIEDKAEANSSVDNNNKPTTNVDVAKKVMESFSEDITSNAKQAADSKKIVREACTNVGSLKESEFDIRFNPDILSDVRHTGTIDTEPPKNKEQADKLAAQATQFNSLKQQRQLVVDAAEFLVTVQIPLFINEYLNHSSAPMEGTTLAEAMHSRGINMRYLGKVANGFEKIPQLEYMHRITVQELILRSAKHIFHGYMQNTDLINMASSVSHFLNGLLVPASHTLSPSLTLDELCKQGKRGKNKRPSASKTIGSSRVSVFGGEQSYDWVSMTQKSLWQQIKRELKAYYDYDLGVEASIDAVVEAFKFHKLTLLRAFCMKVGIQVLLREYNFESKNKPTFNEDDIVNMFPIVKHINPRATDAYNFFTTGQTKIQQGNFKEGYELISESLHLLNNVYGAMHSENSQCLRMMARLSYIMGDLPEAISMQQRAVLMSERVNGIDHPYTISEYVSFGHVHVISMLKDLCNKPILFCRDYRRTWPSTVSPMVK